MCKINSEMITKFQNEYLNNKIFTVGRNALTQNSISNLVYVKEQEKNTQKNFTIDLDNLPVLNQGASRRCWIYSGLEILRKHMIEQYNIEDFIFSSNYISFYDKLEKANFFIETMTELINRDIDDREIEFMLRKGIRDGGYWQNFVNLINKYGIVPEYVFPDTYSSSNTKELNELLSKYLRKFTIEIRKNKNKNNINEIKEKTLQDVYNILCNCQGIPPNQFDFEFKDKNNKYKIIKNITPLEFFNTYIKIDFEHYHDIINYPSPNKPFNKTYTVKHLYNVLGYKENLFLNLNYTRLEEMIIQQLKNGDIVYFSCDNGKYMNNEKGIWNDKQYDYENLFQIDLSLEKGEMLDSRECYFGHTMVITGIELEDNRIKRFKIKNSWGKSETNSGYWIATPSWMKKYLYQIVIKEDYMLKDEIELLKTKPIELNIWDSLAELT